MDGFPLVLLNHLVVGYVRRQMGLGLSGRAGLIGGVGQEEWIVRLGAWDDQALDLVLETLRAVREDVG